MFSQVWASKASLPFLTFHYFDMRAAHSCDASLALVSVFQSVLSSVWSNELGDVRQKAVAGTFKFKKCNSEQPAPTITVLM